MEEKQKELDAIRKLQMELELTRAKTQLEQQKIELAALQAEVLRKQPAEVTH